MNGEFQWNASNDYAGHCSEDYPQCACNGGIPESNAVNINFLRSNQSETRLNRNLHGDSPTPPHPQKRRQPLPEQAPKDASDDPGGPAAIQAILNSPSYREADRDIDFLQEDESRGLRLELEYLKVDTVLKQHNVAHTIVVFGGTRILEPQAAGRQLKQVKAALAADPSNQQLKQQNAIAQRIRAKSSYYDVAREFGRLVGSSAGNAPGGQILIVTGGGPGIMEAANRGASDVGAKSIGLNISLPHEQFPNPYVSPELCFTFRYFALRKLHFIMRARALVAFPGGFGTLDELFEVLALSQTRKTPPVPVVLVGESYWRQVFNPDFLFQEGVIDAEDLELFWFAETASDAWRSILRWYEKKGEPLIEMGGFGA